ncbi:MAG: GspE/PulE family protein, partial [Candidatus Binatia bacterium]
MSRLGELFLKRSLITPDQLIKAITEQQQQGGILAAHLLRLGFVTEEQLVSTLQKEYRLPIVDPTSLEVTGETLQLIPQALAAKHHLLPLNLAGSTLTVAMADPSNLVAVNEVKFLTGYDIRIVLANLGALRKAIERLYEGRSAYQDVLTELVGQDVEVVRDDQEIDPKELERATEEAPVVRLVNALMADAIRRRASDIHVEPFEKMLRVRFRVDGVLYEIMKPPLKLKNPLVSRLKIMAALDIA